MQEKFRRLDVKKSIIITKNGYNHSVWSQKRVQPGIESKHAPRAITLLIGQNISYPFIRPFLRGNDPQVHLPAANYTLGLIQVQFRGLTSDWDQQVRKGSGPKAPEELCGGKRCLFYLVSVCACFMPCSQAALVFFFLRAWFIRTIRMCRRIIRNQQVRVMVELSEMITRVKIEDETFAQKIRRTADAYMGYEYDPPKKWKVVARRPTQR